MANIVQWQDLFVIIDDGHVSIREYERLEPMVRVQAKGCPNGLGCFVIIPEKAVPPPSTVRQHLEGMLSRLPIRALAYLVEGTGFKAATVRAALIGLGIFQRKGYPSKVFTETDEALSWLLTGAKGPGDVRAALKVITESRTKGASSGNQPAPKMSRRMSK
jgi:hypothetical protein